MRFKITQHIDSYIEAEVMANSEEEAEIIFENMDDEEFNEQVLANVEPGEITIERIEDEEEPRGIEGEEEPGVKKLEELVSKAIAELTFMECPYCSCRAENFFSKDDVRKWVKENYQSFMSILYGGIR